ncbi:MAG: sigma-54-dependent Fis family transcriptional regulator [Deltaproteobacteria bacterium]|nr:MAG: sigma-54-dependent Fis family transcriptional regulator [Deltaproteobacteria bacterium]
MILLVDDEPLILRALRRILERDGHRVLEAESAADAETALGDPDLDVVLIDVMLGRTSGLQMLDRVKASPLETEVVMMTGYASIDSAVECMRRGAFDYLTKPFEDFHRVRTTVRKAIERRRLIQRNRELEQELSGRRDAPVLVGGSQGIRSLRRMIEGLRHNGSHVLIQGESGTGKELVAQSIHAASRRAPGPFVPVDCGALPESIIESELFGHERGAFTGAVGAPGLFRMADHGTLFLDEIGELPPSMQAKLLRALQEKEVRPVGGSGSIAVDIRVVSATHRDLWAMVEERHFRADLYYRLNVVRITIPPLRERKQDIPQLVQHFLSRHRDPERPIEGVDDEALAALARYEWPGNVRELFNTIESALAFARGPNLRPADLSLVRRHGEAASAPPATVPLSFDAYERCALQRALRESSGDAREAARRLGIGRSTLYRKLGKHGLLPRRAGVSPLRPIR